MSARLLACAFIAIGTAGFFWIYDTAKNYTATPSIELARYNAGTTFPRVQTIARQELLAPDMKSEAVIRASADVPPTSPSVGSHEGPTATSSETTGSVSATTPRRKSRKHGRTGYDAFAQAPPRRRAEWSIPHGGF